MQNLSDRRRGFAAHFSPILGTSQAKGRIYWQTLPRHCQLHEDNPTKDGDSAMFQVSFGQSLKSYLVSIIIFCPTGSKNLCYLLISTILFRINGYRQKGRYNQNKDKNLFEGLANCYLLICRVDIFRVLLLLFQLLSTLWQLCSITIIIRRNT